MAASDRPLKPAEFAPISGSKTGSNGPKWPSTRTVAIALVAAALLGVLLFLFNAKNYFSETYYFSFNVMLVKVTNLTLKIRKHK